MLGGGCENVVFGIVRRALITLPPPLWVRLPPAKSLAPSAASRDIFITPHSPSL
ncbi:hypothetical protein TIFTF001_004975 [Ficus carica]|uniref:Uncharacterized protein n=1 Tax=Ficus carica TaxID=3494 RepID=A0AA87ZJ85_FICCA|nr:hypothetical protein TIFTF001_004975 [Ficus carica]